MNLFSTLLFACSFFANVEKDTICINTHYADFLDQANIYLKGGDTLSSVYSIPIYCLKKYNDTILFSDRCDFADFINFKFSGNQEISYMHNDKRLSQVILNSEEICVHWGDGNVNFPLEKLRSDSLQTKHLFLFKIMGFHGYWEIKKGRVNKIEMKKGKVLETDANIYVLNNFDPRHVNEILEDNITVGRQYKCSNKSTSKKSKLVVIGDM